MKRNPIKQIEDAQSISWLAGLLEGEGTFLTMAQGSASFALEMTDEDVVAKVADLLGVRYFKIQPRQAHHKVSYRLRVRGPRAGYYLNLILPHMGERRTQKIEECLSRINESVKLHQLLGKQLAEKISDTEFMEGWNARPAATSFRAFARSLGISSRTSLATRIEKLSQNTVAEYPDAPHHASKLDEIAWLAGILEGEGSFSRCGDAVVLKLHMTDEDVVARVAKLLGTRYLAVEAAKTHWKRSFRLTRSGKKCIDTLRIIRPFMGERRLSRIDELIAFYEERKMALKASQIEARHEEFQRWIHRKKGESMLQVTRSLGIKNTTYRKRLIKAGLHQPSKHAQNL